jgi:hypothetical protein
MRIDTRVITAQLNSAVRRIQRAHNRGVRREATMQKTIFFLLIVFWIMTAAHAQQVPDGPSIEDTITYINSHSARRHDNYLVSVSLEKSLLILQHTVPNMCGAGCDGTILTTVPFRVISHLKSDIAKDPDGTGEVWLHCPQYQTSDGFNYEKCMHFSLVTPHPSKFETEQGQGGIEAVAFDDSDQANRLQHALTHLFTLLDQRYQQQIQQRDPNDPFK